MARKEQSRGSCTYCGKEMTKGGLSRHLKSCKSRAGATAQAAGGDSQTIYHLQVQDAWSGDYWLHLEMSGQFSQNGYVWLLWTSRATLLTVAIVTIVILTTANVMLGVDQCDHSQIAQKQKGPKEERHPHRLGMVQRVEQQMSNVPQQWFRVGPEIPAVPTMKAS